MCILSPFTAWRPFHPTGIAFWVTLTLMNCNLARGVEPRVAVERAVGYLAVEVPKWHRENQCYSCHNNGDAVRALIAASRDGLLSDGGSLEDTLRFLSVPERWDANGPDGPFKDEKLARIQFAAALADATASGIVKNRSPLIAAAKFLAKLQREDGSWPSDAEGTIGSPVTYGQPLATAISLRTLLHANRDEFSEHIQRGKAWFAKREPRNVLDAAATVLALGDSETAQGKQRLQEALEIIRRGQSPDGGWGPFVNAAPEVFDTAIVLIAVESASARPLIPKEMANSIERGRAYLLAAQNADGSWPATTRPPGVDSYAQQVSTTGWALLASSAKTLRNPSARAPEKHNESATGASEH